MQMHIRTTRPIRDQLIERFDQAAGHPVFSRRAVLENRFLSTDHQSTRFVDHWHPVRMQPISGEIGRGNLRQDLGIESSVSLEVVDQQLQLLVGNRLELLGLPDHRGF